MFLPNAILVCPSTSNGAGKIYSPIIERGILDNALVTLNVVAEDDRNAQNELIVIPNAAIPLIDIKKRKFDDIGLDYGKYSSLY